MPKYLIPFYVFLSLSISVLGQDSGQVIAWDDHWMEIDEGTGALVPYNQGSGEHQSGSLLLTADRFVSVGLQICMEQGSSIYLNQKIIHHQEEQGCRTFSCDSLFRAFAKDTLLLTVYHPEFSTTNTQINLISDYELPEVRDTLQIEQRGRSASTAFLLTVTIILLVTLAAIRTVNLRGLQDFFNFRLAFYLNTKLERRNTLRVFDQFNILLMIFYSACFSLLLIILALRLPDWQEYFAFLLVSGYWMLLLYWLLLTAAMSVMLFFKYILIRMVASWFQLTSFADLHLIDYIRLSMAFITVILIVLLYGNLSGGMSSVVYSLLVVVLSIFLLVRTIILFFKLLTFSTFRKLHLFSYLCTTEIIPLSIIIKVLFHGL